AHRDAGLVPDVAADQDRAVGHPPLAPPIGGADQVPCPARHPDQAAVHLAPDPVAGIPVDHDPPAGHQAADVATRVAVNMDFARAHAIADVVDPLQVPLEVDPAVGRVAGDGEQLGERQLAVAVVGLQPLDLGQGLVAEPVRSHALDLDGYVRPRAVAQGQ